MHAKVSLLVALLLTGGPVGFISADSTLERGLLKAGTVELTSVGRETLTASFTGTANIPATTISAGTIAEAMDGTRIVTLRDAPIGAGLTERATLEIPIASLSSKSRPESRSFQFRNDRDERLESFLKYASNRDDLPKSTAQLVVFALLEDISFQSWLRFRSPSNRPQIAEAVAEGIDALGILRHIAPGRTFALASDNELKMRALRDPVTRPKALQLYGMVIPGTPTDREGNVPDLGRLLHTKAGDNCPVCKMRQDSNRAAADL